MRAIVHRVYGPPELLRLEQLPDPRPAPAEALIAIRAIGLNRSDWEGLTGSPFYARVHGLRRPRYPMLGSDIAGEVIAVGSEHREFAVGDQVYGELPGYQGAFAEQTCTHGRTLARVPPALTLEVAAAIPQGATIAWRALHVGGSRIAPGTRLLINGAGGAAGTMLVQLGRHFGAEVSCVDDLEKFELLRALGAHHLIDFRREDFAQHRQRYDLVVDLVASRSVHEVQRSLAPGGRYLFVGGGMRAFCQVLLLPWWLNRGGRPQARLLAVPQSRDALLAVSEFVLAGTLRPIIERFEGLDSIPAALRRIGAASVRGKLVVRMS
jgi:NADPH:quinone reductase-like Zn-dependent oxidoreductase